MKRVFLLAAALLLVGAGCAQSRVEHPYPGKEPFNAPAAPPPAMTSHPTR